MKFAVRCGGAFLVVALLVAGCGGDPDPELWVSSKRVKLQPGITGSQFVVMNTGGGRMDVQLHSNVVDITPASFALNAGEERVVLVQLKAELLTTLEGSVEGEILVSAGSAGHATLRVEGEILAPARDLISTPDGTTTPVNSKDFANAEAFDAFLEELGPVVNDSGDTVWAFSRSDDFVMRVDFTRGGATMFIGDYSLATINRSTYRATCNFGMQGIWNQRISPFDASWPEADEIRFSPSVEEVTLQAGDGALFVDGERFAHDDRL